MLSDVEARRIASEWHGGVGSALYVLASTGAIVDGVSGEIYRNILDERSRIGTDDPDPSREDHQGLWDLEGLRSYVRESGRRGPVEGWGNLNW